MIPWFGLAGLVLGCFGLYLGLWVAPTDVQQGEAYRIIFVHVPAAWMSMVVYLAMAFWAGIGLVFNSRLSSMLATALAPTGAWMTFLALWTGALWGKPTWGAWWVWDARLTSELVLLFLYIGYMSLHAAIDDVRRARPVRRPAGAGGRGQCAHYLFLGQMVEYAAPGRFGKFDQIPQHGHYHAAGHAGDGAGVLDVLHRRRAGTPAHHDTGTRTPHRVGAARVGGGMNWSGWSQFFAMGGYGLYVWGSFGMCAVVLILEMALVGARRRALVREHFDTAGDVVGSDA